MNDFSFLCLETDHSSHMARSLFFRAFFQRIIGESGFVSERFIELDNEIVLEVLRNTTAILGRVADDLVFFRDDFDIRSIIQCIDNNVGMVVFRESETEQCCTVGRRQFGYHIMVSQIGFIIIRFSHLALMREPAGTFILIELRSTYHRHNRELSVIVDPRAWLMGLLETTNFICRIDILPSVSHLSGLWRPEIHTPGTRNSRIGISCRQLETRLSSHQRHCILYRIEGTRTGSCHSRLPYPGHHRDQSKSQYTFLIHVLLIFS